MKMIFPKRRMGNNKRYHELEEFGNVALKKHTRFDEFFACPLIKSGSGSFFLSHFWSEVTSMTTAP
jgi:hypothetical protein